MGGIVLSALLICSDDDNKAHINLMDLILSLLLILLLLSPFNRK